MMVIEHVIDCSVPFCDSDDVHISAVCKTEWKPKILSMLKWRHNIKIQWEEVIFNWT